MGEFCSGLLHLTTCRIDVFSSTRHIISLPSHRLCEMVPATKLQLRKKSIKYLLTGINSPGTFKSSYRG